MPPSTDMILSMMSCEGGGKWGAFTGSPCGIDLTRGGPVPTHLSFSMIGRGLSTLEYGIPALPIDLPAGPGSFGALEPAKDVLSAPGDAALRQQNYLVPYRLCHNLLC